MEAGPASRSYRYLMEGQAHPSNIENFAYIHPLSLFWATQQALYLADR